MQTEKRKNEPKDNISAKKAKWTKKGSDKEGGKNGNQKFTKNDKKENHEKSGKAAEEPLKRSEVKRNRKMRENPNFETEMAMKKLWEKLRNAETAGAREEFVKTIFGKISVGDKSLSDFAFAHDTTRVLQSCLQHGSVAQRRFIYTSLKDKIPEMAQSKYARNVVLKLIKYGERDIKDHCIENMGNVRKLVRSNIGQSVLEYAFNQFAQSKQRNEIVSKLYGKSYIRLSKTEKDPTLISVVTKNVDFCETILTDFMDDLKSLTEKEVMQQTISHRAFLDFFNLCLYLLHSENEQIMEKRKRVEEIRSELIEELKGSVIHMIHTPDGARVGLHCLWFGSAKDRKLILKTMKEFLVKVVTAEHGYLIALGAIDAVDDTVLVRKMLVSPICKELDTLMKEKPARKVIWYILNARDPKTFLPDVIKLLEVGDQSMTCKKPRDVKYTELKTGAMPHLLEWFSENIASCFDDAGLLPMLVTALQHDQNNFIFKDEENMLVTVHKAIANKLNGDYNAEEHPLRQKGVQMSIRKIIAFDKERTEHKFSRTFAQVCKEFLPTWLSDNRGSFLLLNLIESEDEETIEIVKEAINERLTSHREEINKTKGGNILLKKINTEHLSLTMDTS